MKRSPQVVFSIKPILLVIHKDALPISLLYSGMYNITLFMAANSDYFWMI